MSNYALLDNVNHKDLKVITEFSEKYGNNTASILTFPSEFSDIQREYPILFRKDKESEKFQSIALVGLQPDENLFLKGGKWDGYYVPAMVARDPFLIGFRNPEEVADSENNAMVHIDLDSPRVSTSEGKPLFSDLGGNTPYLNRIAHTLELIHRGTQLNDILCDALTHFELLEPVKLDVKLDDGTEIAITGNHTINREKFNRLKGEDLAKLNQTGLLEGIFLVMASMDNIYRLVARKNTQL